MRIFILSLVLGLFSLETMALSCDITNYTDYLWNGNLTNKLIKETGAGCILTKADLQGASLYGANLKKANLREANLLDADLRGADLWRAHLELADLEGAHLQGASLREAYLFRANLQRAKLQGVNLAAADPKEANFENAIYDSDTDFPGWDSTFKKDHNMIEMIEEK